MYHQASLLIIASLVSSIRLHRICLAVTLPYELDNSARSTLYFGEIKMRAHWINC